MNDWHARGSAYVHLLLDLAAEHGISPEDCLRKSGITARNLEDPLYEVKVSQELAATRNLVHRLANLPDAGLVLGSRFRLTNYGILGYALLSSSTLRSAAELAIRNFDLTFAFNRFQVTDVKEGVLIALDDRDLPEDCRQFLVERDAAAIAALCSQLLLKSLPILKVSFRFKRPAYAERFADFFHGPVAFASPINGILISADCANQPLPLAEVRTVQICEEQCKEIMDRQRLHEQFSERVRQHLLRPGHGYEMDKVAAELGMAPRTLRRHLVAEGTTFRQLVDEVRQALAEEMLQNRMPVEAVAERLGYADGSSFTHAFKRWKGVSPRTHRRHEAAD